MRAFRLAQGAWFYIIAGGITILSGGYFRVRKAFIEWIHLPLLYFY